MEKEKSQVYSFKDWSFLHNDQNFKLIRPTGRLYKPTTLLNLAYKTHISLLT